MWIVSCYLYLEVGRPK